MKKSLDFRRSIREGGRATGKYITVCALPNTYGLTRLGAGSTKRLGNAAERNRQKRLVREAFRLTKHELPENFDLIVLPKTPWPEPSLEELKIDLVEAARRAASLTKR